MNKYWVMLWPYGLVTPQSDVLYELLNSTKLQKCIKNDVEV